MTPDRTSEENSSAWQTLRRWTHARVALDRAGGSVTTKALLDFRLAHAHARDALLRPLDENSLAQTLADASGRPLLRLESAAQDLEEYLQRPDRGRVLSAGSAEILKPSPQAAFDLVIIITEGLSTLAVETHAAPVLEALLPLLDADGWQLAPVCLVRRGRVAVQDHVGELLQARLALILLGERPGLVSPDSLGAYLVHTPRRGNTDARRNCVSNISALGLNPVQAAAKLHWLLQTSRQRNVSGVDLKDEHDARLTLTQSGSP